MRTILNIDDDLHRRAKAHAARTGTTLTALVEEALRMRLTRSPTRASGPVVLPTFAGDGLQPGVTLDDMDTVYDAMDGLR
jgi:plasmid stability protein